MASQGWQSMAVYAMTCRLKDARCWLLLLPVKSTTTVDLRQELLYLQSATSCILEALLPRKGQLSEAAEW